MAICLRYYELFVTCISLPISMRHRFLKLTFCCFHAVRTKKCSCFFQMFSIQYFILDPKTLRFPRCCSFLGQIIGWRKAKWSPDGLYPRQRAINNSLPNVSTIFNSCSNWKCQQYVVPQQQFSLLVKQSQNFKANCSKNFVVCSMFTADKCFLEILK